MIPRYTPLEMGRLWSDQRKYDTWLRVESAAADAMADHGLIPLDAACDIREKGKVYTPRSRKILILPKPDKPKDMIGTFGNEEKRSE